MRHAWEIRGTAGHAGTTPMAGRRDALAAAAELVLAIEEIGRETPDLVATVGVLDAEPGAMNVIPGRVVLTVRHPAPGRRAARLRADRASTRRRPTSRPGAACRSPPPSSPATRPCRATHASARSSPTRSARRASPRATCRAAPDTTPAALARICPVAMLFLRCEGGISHNPAENVDVLDVAIALDVMERAILDLGMRP